MKNTLTRFVINLGLDRGDRAFPGDRASFDSAIKQVFATGVDFGVHPTTVFEVAEGERGQALDGTVWTAQEATLIIHVDVFTPGAIPHAVATDKARAYCTELCSIFEQDCVALVRSATAKTSGRAVHYRVRYANGQLVGPKAEAWGPFNPALFAIR